ncbi:signal recognition particle 9 kDa protein-like [Rhopilema esculentum]|uniref:signal recognition particle 9 kDa protein-like n=1 Tax=Rhopilema esculentum TaxID=499914 RepID=UPI0031E428CC
MTTKGPYVESWEDFAKRAELLYLNNPDKIRFVVKYRNCDGNLVLKITDDKVCLKYRTEHAQDVKKLEKLNSVLMRHICTK